MSEALEKIKESFETFFEEVKLKEVEYCTLRGKIINRNPQKIKEIKKENEEMEAYLKNIQNFLFKLILNNESEKSAEHQKKTYDILKQDAIRFFSEHEIEVDQWKDLESSS
ncbi:MAG: hypothetical protein CL678_12960 [Bdellovibrionaceae bacterium]|nr:hypothetical protein [Pseudobdellovibrionaceae bacterium]|tara:strand:- start:11543 stop:11875 length:333 start_codon:yes stop_codon:yes gene_type:complete